MSALRNVFPDSAVTRLQSLPRAFQMARRCRARTMPGCPDPRVCSLTNFVAPMTSTSLFRSIIADLGEYALASLIVIAFAALGAAGSETAALTLDDCLRLAADNHPALTAAAAGVTAANESVGEAKSALLAKGRPQHRLSSLAATRLPPSRSDDPGRSRARNHRPR